MGINGAAFRTLYYNLLQAAGTYIYTAGIGWEQQA
jgi:hypothetical protein